MGLIIRSSRIHAAGCYTTAPIAKGSRVVEYTGPVLEKSEADLRYAGRPITYLFGIGDGSRVIDGHGTAMFVNHSCDANCETEEIDDRVWIMAIRDIAVGEELCYDYRLYDGDDDDLPCNCDSLGCRGSMYSPEELRRRKRKTIEIKKKHLRKANPRKSSPRKSKPRTTGQAQRRRGNSGGLAALRKPGPQPGTTARTKPTTAPGGNSEARAVRRSA